MQLMVLFRVSLSQPFRALEQHPKKRKEEWEKREQCDYDLDGDHEELKTKIAIT